MTVTLGGVGVGVVTSTPAAIRCPDVCSASFAEGTTVSLVAEPGPHERFVGWMGACTGNGDCRLDVSSSVEVVAEFEIRPMVSAGGGHTCAVSKSGAVRCWGSNQVGQLGYNSTATVGDGLGASIRSAGDVPVGLPVRQVAAGLTHTCALTTADTVRCWGQNDWGQLGYDNKIAVGDGQGRTIEEAGDVPIGRKAHAIAVGFLHSCALTDESGVRCWGTGILGYGATGQVGDGQGPTIDAVGDLELGVDARAITANTSHSCVVGTDSSARCWGNNEAGQLGYGHTTDIGFTERSIVDAGPIPVGATVDSVAAGGFHTCAVLTDGRVRCWGENRFGQLGYDHTSSVAADLTATIQDAGDVVVGAKCVQVSAGGQHTCVRLEHGPIRCWGRGSGGRLGYDSIDNIGDGVGERIFFAGNVPLGANATWISAGGFHTCAVLESDGIRCWGENHNGQLGYGNTERVGDGVGPTIQEAGDVPVW